VATVAAYVDGFNLYYGMKSRYGRKYMWLDVVELVRQLRRDEDVEVVRYFTTIVKNEPSAATNQNTYIDALVAHNGGLIDVRVGRFRQRTIGPCRICRREFLCACPSPYLSYEEKETDVALGVAMAEDAAFGRADMALLISADSDLRPAIAATKRLAPRQPVYVALPPSRFLRQMRFPGAGVFHVRESALRAAQLPPVVTDLATGRRFERPAKWS
jgi:uncharacterized LabA/DUF88 family protein